MDREAQINDITNWLVNFETCSLSVDLWDVMATIRNNLDELPQRCIDELASRAETRLELYAIQERNYPTFQTFKKQYKLRIHNSGIQIVEHMQPGFENGKIVVFPYHDLPVHLLSFYLSEEEMRQMMSSEVYVHECSVKVDHKKAIVGNQTNATTSTVGEKNLDIHLNCISGGALVDDRSGWFVNEQFTSASTGIQEQGALVQDIFWGTHLDNDTNANDGHVVNYNNRFAYIHMDSVNSSIGTGFDPSNCDMFPIYDYVDWRANALMTEGELVTWKYTPRNGFVNFNAWNHDSKGDLIDGVGLVPGEISTANLARIPIEDRMNPNSFQGKINALTIGIEPDYSLVNETAASELVQCHIDLVITTRCVMRVYQGVN